MINRRLHSSRAGHYTLAKIATMILGVILAFLFAVNTAHSQICRIDLGIILDDSGSIKRWGFEQEKRFVRDLTRQLRISGANTRVSVMTFSTYPRMRIFFRDRSGQNWNSLNWALNGVLHSGGWTYTDKALHLARNQMFHQNYGSRSGAPKTGSQGGNSGKNFASFGSTTDSLIMLLLLTDGKSQSGHSKLSYAANLLKNNFVNIISIGVGYQVRRSELELIASRPINQHVFQVRDAGALNRIVHTVRTEACKPITCWFIECIYNEWSSWSGTCYTVRRTRTVRQQVRKSKMVVGGCAGLNVLACKSEVETKNLGVCLQTCRYVKCLWGQWGAWSASCGRASRQRSIRAKQATTQRRTCHGLPQRCYERPKTEYRNTKCTCNYVECNYGSWSAWSTTCGRGERSRRMQATRKTVQRESCNGLPQTCSNTPDIQTRNKKCSCEYVDCQYGPWSQWTTSCGKGERSRKLQPIKKVKQAVSCAGLPQTCSATPQIDKRTKLCSCKYVDCKYGPWSQWTTSCGKGERSRTLQAVSKTKNAESCAGLPQTCSKTPQIDKRTKLCSCNYVECSYGPWSEWTTSCGKGQRGRKMQTTQKTKQAESCDGLPQTCSTKPDIEERTKLCSCNYVECSYGPWSEWTTSCGKGQRGRKMQATRKTKQAESCNGLPQTCSTKPDIEERTKLCSCNYVECSYGPWSEWTTSCGKGQRGRKMQATQKTKQAKSCDGLPQTCSTKPDIEERTKFCSCNYVECSFGPWSEWTTSCGKGQRGRKMQATQKTKQAESCDGLPQTCSTKPDIEERTKLCKCNYVECKYTQWSDWNPNCGKNMARKRTLQTLKKSIEKESCDGLPQACNGDAEQTEKKDELCECDAVKCVAQWSSWSKSCGLATRTMRFVKVPIKVKQESCDGLKTSCPDITETQTDDLFCARTRPPVTSAPPSDALCSIGYKRLGCFKDNKDFQSTLKKILFVEAYKKSKGFGFSDYLYDMVCRCATKANLEKLDVFAISREGHCLAGKGNDDSWQKHSAVALNACKNSDQQECHYGNTVCIGHDSTHYAYLVIN